MSRQPSGGGNGDVARGAGYAALLGALLIGVAVIIGIVLLQIGDRNDNGPAAARTHNNTSTTRRTTTTKPHRGTKAPVLRPPKAIGALHLIVLNGGAASGQATHVSAALKLKGYTNQPLANTWTGHHQTGTTVYCRTGLTREGTALAIAVGPAATLHLPFPTPAPPFTAGFDCAVIVGA